VATVFEDFVYVDELENGVMIRPLSALHALAEAMAARFGKKTEGT
jgi:hypothetical protein